MKDLVKVLLVIMVFSVNSWAVERHVPSQYPNIQAAVDACSDGDEVVVADGTYTGTGNRDLQIWEYDITLRSQNGPEYTIIDCQSSSWGDAHYAINASECTVSGFTIKNAYQPTGSHPLLGSAVHLYAAVLDNCIITNNTGVWAGGVYCEENSIVKDCIIRNNTAIAQYNSYTKSYDLGAGGGIFIWDGKIINCLIALDSHKFLLCYFLGRTVVLAFFLLALN